MTSRTPSRRLPPRVGLEAPDRPSCPAALLLSPMSQLFGICHSGVKPFGANLAPEVDDTPSTTLHSSLAQEGLSALPPIDQEALVEPTVRLDAAKMTAVRATAAPQRVHAPGARPSNLAHSPRVEQCSCGGACEPSKTFLVAVLGDVRHTEARCSRLRGCCVVSGLLPPTPHGASLVPALPRRGLCLDRVREQCSADGTSWVSSLLSASPPLTGSPASIRSKNWPPDRRLGSRAFEVW